jgi:drug/metabolite transporter (DMT)-like permease
MSAAKGDTSKKALLSDDGGDVDAGAGVTGTKSMSAERKARLLVISFAAMLAVGCGNRIFSVLQYAPMQNYPLFVNMLTTFAYLPTSLLYVGPMVYGFGPWVKAQGWGSMEAVPVAQWKWATMGFLDSVAGVMQAVAIANLSNGQLVVLLLQSAIPVSMLITKIFLKTKYSLAQYSGATIVVAGLLVTLGPSLVSGGSGGNNIGLWAAMLIGSCIPMCLSSVFKEKALGDVEIDPIWFNLAVAFYQFIFSFPLLPPTAISVGLSMDQIFPNLWDGMRCYAGLNSIDSDNCAMGPTFTTLYILVNLAYNVLIILILKYGSSNILWLAMTATLPISSLVFAIPGIPSGEPVSWSVGVGLPLIFSGLVIYRFWPQIRIRLGYAPLPAEGEEESAELVSVAAAEGE